MRKIISVIACFAILFCLCSCGFDAENLDKLINGEPKVKVFQIDGLYIELNRDFMKMNFISDEYDFIFGDGDVTVLGLYSAVEGVTAEEYAEYFYESLEGADPAGVTKVGEVPTVGYTSVDDEVHRYIVAFYETDGGIWSVTFGGEERSYNERYEDICKYIKSVGFKTKE